MIEYRVVRDGYEGYEVQARLVFWKIKSPWIQIDAYGNDLLFGTNTFCSLERAIAHIKSRKVKKEILHQE